MTHPIHWLRRLFSRTPQYSLVRRAGRPRSWDRFLLQLERLEDRLAPATIITVLNAANLTGSLDGLLAKQNGTINPGDGGSGGTLPETLSSGALAALPATDNISITAQDAIAFDDLGGTLTLAASANHSVSFTANAGAIGFANPTNTLATGGASLSFDANTSLTLANLNSAGGSVALFAESGAVGTQNIVTGASGNGAEISVQAQGNIVVDTLSADFISLTSNNGSVGMDSGGLLQGIDLNINASTGIDVQTLVDDVSAFNQVSGDISITQAASPATPLSVDMGGITNGADAKLATAGGAITVVNLGSSITLVPTLNSGDIIPGGPVQTDKGIIQLLATDLDINNTINSGTARTVLGNSVAGTPIDLGTNTAGSIGLTQTEINEVSAAGLQVGTSTAGAITVSQPIALTTSTGLDLLDLETAGQLTQGAGDIISLATGVNLAIRAQLGVNLSGDNAVAGQLAAVVAGAGSPFSFTNLGNLMIGTADGLNGITTLGGAISLSLTGANDLLTVAQPLDTTNAGILSAGADVTLSADNMAINAGVNAGAGVATLAPFTVGQLINLGGNDANGTLGLTNGELNHILAGILRIGGATAGNVTVTAAIAPPTPVVHLITGAAITETAGATIDATNLALQAPAGVNLGQPNTVTTLAGTTNNAAFTFAAAATFTIGTVDGVININAGTGTVTLNSTGAVLGAGTDASDVTASALVVNGAAGVGTPATALNTTVTTLTASGGSGGVNVANTGNLTIVGAPDGLAATGGDIAVSTTGTLTDASATVNSAAAGNVTFKAGPSISVTGAVTALGGTVTFQGDAFNVGPTMIAFDGAVLAAKQALVLGGSFGDTFNFGPSTTTPITVDGGPGPGFGANQGDTFNLNLNGGLHGSSLAYNFSLTYAPSGFFGAYNNLVDALGNAFQNITIENIENPVPTAGFQFNAANNVLDVSATNFSFAQAPNLVTLVADGNTENFPQANVPSILVNGATANATATLTTNDSFVNGEEQVQQATEYIVLSNSSGTLYRLNATGNPTAVIGLGGFHSLTANLTHADFGEIIGTSGLINRFVSNGASAYMNSGTQAQFNMLDQQDVQDATANYFISGANYVYGYSAGAADTAFHYDGTGPSTLVMSGTAYSYMSGTDQNQSFFNVAEGFTHTIGIAEHNVHDTAYFYDTSPGDVFVGSAPYSALYHIDPDNTVSEYDFALGFALVFATSFANNDSAVNYSPATVSVTGFAPFG